MPCWRTVAKPVSVESEEVPTAPSLSRTDHFERTEARDCRFHRPNGVRSTSRTVDELWNDELETPVTLPIPSVSEETIARTVQKEAQAKPVEQAPEPTTIVPKQEKDDEQPATVDVEPEEAVRPALEVQGI